MTSRKAGLRAALHTLMHTEDWGQGLPTNKRERGPGGQGLRVPPSHHESESWLRRSHESGSWSEGVTSRTRDSDGGAAAASGQTLVLEISWHSQILAQPEWHSQSGYLGTARVAHGISSHNAGLP